MSWRWFISAALLLLSIYGQAQQSLQVLQHHVRPPVSSGQAAQLGSLPPGQRLNVSIVLPLRNQSQLTSLLGRLYDPSSPDYRHFLDAAQFTAQFGPTREDYQAVVDFAQANGLTVTATPTNRLIVPIDGSVAQIEKAFNVRMNVYRHPAENRTFYSPDREPSLNLSVPVAHIAGLNNYSLPRPMVTKAAEGQAIADVSGSGPGGSYLGSDMRAAYYTGSLPTGASALTGIGQAVGLLEFDGYKLSDVNSTFSNAGQSLGVRINNVLLDGVTGAPAYGDDSEQALDIVQAIGMAPGLSQVRVYIGSSDVDIFNSMATENIAKQLSVSWSWDPDDPSADDVFFQEFAAQGQSVFVASGDNGAFDANISPYFYPGEDAYVTAVGATHLTTNGAGGPWVAETAWNSYEHGSGGGISPDGIAIPSWQAGVANSPNGGSTTQRNLPDVSMEGDYDNYACDMGACGGGWAGTSFAAPRWAAFMALLNQQAQEAGTASSGGLGFINPAIYSIGEGSSYASGFHDIASGNNDTYTQPVWYNAVAGYDLVTGWGSPAGQNLIDALAGPQVPGFWIANSSGSILSIDQAASSASTVTVTYADGFTGSVNLAASGLPGGVTASWSANPTTTSSLLTLIASSAATPGTSTVTIIGSSGAWTATTTVTLTVVEVPTSTTILAVTAEGVPVASVAAGTVVTLTAAVNAGPAAVTPGLVKFCDATAAHCEDIHLLGTAQLTSAGTAVLKFVPGIGSHSYKAVFVGTNSFETSSSSTAMLTVTGTQASTAAIAQSGSPGSYTLSAMVTGQGLVSPTGVLSFLDTSKSNAVLGTALLGQGEAVLTWLTSLSLAADFEPSSIVVGDFNGDGIPDLAITNEQESGGAYTTTILLGNGDGTFSAAASPTTGQAPQSVVVGDFNGDGIQDLAIANGGASANVTIFLGNGNGTFTQTATAPAGDGPVFIAVGDFNGDGIPDLAVANQNSNTVTILLGNGDGTFTPAASPAAAPSPNSVVAGDFNGDGVLDLAVGGAATVTILLGNGDGTFTPAASPATGDGPNFVAVGDLNGDGKQDLAVVNQGGSGTLTILLGNGDGTFTPTASPSTGQGPSFVKIGDFNGDGKVDLAVTNFAGNTVTILLGNGDGTFTPSASVTTGAGPNSIAVGNFNGNGTPDLAVLQADALTIFLSQLTQTATATAIGVSPLGTGIHELVASYPGDSLYSSSTSATTGLTAQKATPTVTVTASSSSLASAQQLQLTVTVSGPTGNPMPTGTVSVTSRAHTSAATTLTGGSATITIPAALLANGADTLTASYSGDNNYVSGLGTATVTVAGSTLVALTSPAPRSVLSGSSVTFTWTAGTGVTDYDLWLGLSGPGSSSLYASGWLTSTSTTVTSLPAKGATVYARLYSLVNGAVQYNDYTYTEAVAGTPATMISPTSGSTLGTSHMIFTWTAGAGVTDYDLWLGTNGPGSSSLYASGWVTSTSTTVASLPAKGATVYARLYSLVNGAVQYNDYTYTEAGTPATMISPTPASTLGISNVKFTWTAGYGATEYQLWLGLNGPGSSSLYASGWVTSTSTIVTSLPAKGATVYARLYSLVNGAVQYNDYTYTD